MSKLTKKELQYQINGLAAEVSTRHNSIMRIHRALASIGVDIFSDDFDLTEPGPQPQPQLKQLKQLDQSVFGGLDEKWRFAMVSSVGIPFVYDYKPTGMRAFLSDSSAQLMVNLEKVMRIDEYDYDTSNWQNSLIERDIARELLEVDLSSELTGSDLCRKMLERGDKFVMCRTIGGVDVISGTYEDGSFVSLNGEYEAVAPINNQGEPLTASEVGL